MDRNNKNKKEDGKTMGALKNIVAAAGILAAAGVGETVYFYNRTMKRGNAKTERTTKMSGTDWQQYFPLMEERKGFVMAQPHSDVYVTSFDGLRLHATYFPALAEEQNVKAEESVMQAEQESQEEAQSHSTAASDKRETRKAAGIKKAVICFHGYTGE